MVSSAMSRSESCSTSSCSWGLLCGSVDINGLYTSNHRGHSVDRMITYIVDHTQQFNGRFPDESATSQLSNEC